MIEPRHQHDLKQGLLRGVFWAAFAGLLLLVANFATAAEPAGKGQALFPYYSAADVMNSATTHHYAKNTGELLVLMAQLNTVTTQYCQGEQSLDTVKRQYASAYLAWLKLSAVVMGPMLENNTVRQIDFRPLRVNLLERVIKSQPHGAQAMAMVGSPAKGFPAFEYLLGHAGFKVMTPECGYAQEVVRDIARSVESLKWSSGRAQESEENSPATSADMQLYFNQLLGAVHKLGWERMEKPLLKKQDERNTGAASEKTWQAHWQGISDLLVNSSQDVPLPQKQVVPLEAYLRGLGKIGLADQLLKHADAVATALQASSTAQAGSVEQAVRAVKALKVFLETEVARGLNVSIQFSSSDGD